MRRELLYVNIKEIQKQLKQLPIVLEAYVDARSEISGFIFLTISSNATAAIEFNPEDAVLIQKLLADIILGFFKI